MSKLSQSDGGLTKIDELIKEYLVFRGFHTTLKDFENERKYDRNQGFQSVRIVNTLFRYIKNFEYNKFLEFWEYLDYTFFTKYPPGRSSVKRLGNALKKFYVVNTILKGKKNKLKRFFETYGNELSKEPEWRDWFVIPFLKSPENHEVLEPYFNEQWAEMLTVSLQNFISTAVLAVEKPKLVTLERDVREKNIQMQKIIDRLQKQLEKARVNLNQANRYIHNLHVKYRIPNADGKVPQADPNHSPSSYKKSRSAGPTEEHTHHSTSPSRASPKTQRSMSLPRSGPGNLVVGSPLAKAEALENKKGRSISVPDGSSLKMTSSSGGSNKQTKCSSVFIKRIFSGHKDLITCVQFSHDDSTLATSSLDETVRVWSTTEASHRGLTTLEVGSQVLSLSWKKNSDRLLVCGSNDGFLRLLDVQKKKIVSEVFVDQHYTHLTSVCCSPTDNSCIVACQQTNNNRLGRLYGYNIISEEIEYYLRYPLETTVAETLSYNNDGKMFCVGGRDGTIRVYDVTQKKEIMKWSAHKGPVSSVHFCEKSILSVGEDRQINEWDIYVKGIVKCTVSIPRNKSIKYKHYKPKISVCRRPGSSPSFVVNSPGCIFQKFGTNNKSYMPTHRLLNPNSIHVGMQNVQMVAVDWSRNGELIAGGEKEVCLFVSAFDEFADLD